MIADDFDEEYLLKEKDGSLQPSHTAWGGGQAFRICPQRAYERYARKNMQMMKDLGFRGLHYHDVYSILEPRICYDPRHPCNPRQSLDWYVKQMEVTRDAVGGTQSEGRLTVLRVTSTIACTSTSSRPNRTITRDAFGGSPRATLPTGLPRHHPVESLHRHTQLSHQGAAQAAQVH